MRPTRIERATYGFEVRYSIQLSYERIVCFAAFGRAVSGWVPDGARTHDNQIHNLTLYH